MATYYTLDGGVQQTYTNYIEVSAQGNHSITFWSVDKAGNVETQHTQNITINTTPPTTTASDSGTVGNNGWYTSNVQVTLSATDPNGSAYVLATYYAVDGGAQQTYTGSFTVSGDSASHTIVYWSVDLAGNTETPNTATIKIDATPPTLAFGTPSPAANAAGWNNTVVGVPYTTSDATSGVATATPGSPISISTQGANQKATVTVTDVAGNSASFTSPAANIDLTPPVTTATPSGTLGNSRIYTGNVTVALSATDNLSGVATTYYTLDGGTLQTNNGTPIAIAGSSSHTLTYYSVNVAGNTETTKTLPIRIDTTAPTTTATLSGTVGSNGWYTTPVQITLAATDPDGAGDVAATYYTIDGGAQQTYSGSFSVTTDSTSHTVVYWSVDQAGNAEAHNTTSFKIDATAPTVTFGSVTPAPNANGWNNTSVTIPFTTFDATSGVATVSHSNPLKYTKEGAGQKQPVVVTDKAGNTATFNPPLVNIDETAPTTTAAVSGVVVTLTATDKLSGVATTYYTVNSGAQQTYSAPVTVTGAGNHTVAYWSVNKAGNIETQHTTTVTVPAVLTSVSISPSTVVGGIGATGTVTLNAAAPVAETVTLSSNKLTIASVPATVTVLAGQSTATFAVNTFVTSASYTVTITASLAGVKATATIKATSGHVPQSINCGGGSSSPFISDTGYSGGTVIGTSHSIDLTGVTNPAPQVVYQTARSGSFTYTIPNLAPGVAYTLTLHFAEFQNSAVGKRVFGVTVNGASALSGVDVYKRAGAEYKAVTQTVSVTANSSGQLVIQFVPGTAGVPMANGIQVQ